MRNIKIIGLTVLLSIMLAGCAAVPENLISITTDSNVVENAQGESTGFEYQQVSTLKKNIESTLSKKYGQIILGDGIEIKLPDTVFQLTFKQIENFESNYKDIFSLFFDEKTWNRQDYTKKNNSDGMISYSFYNTEEKIYCCVGDNGFVSMLQPSGFDAPYNNDENIKIYHIDRGEDASDEYDLLDGKYSIHQAVEYVDNWVINKYEQYEPFYDFKVKTIIVRKNKSSFYFDITVEKHYKGVPLDSLTIVQNSQDLGEALFVMNCLTIQMFQVDEIGAFTNGSGMIIPQKEDKADSIITLESALRFCENKFSDYREINISDINLKYTLTPVYTELDGAYYVAGRTFNSRLVWEFVIDVPPEELVGAGEVNTYGDVRKYIYIDALTGELFFDFQGVLQF